MRNSVWKDTFAVCSHNALCYCVLRERPLGHLRNSSSDRYGRQYHESPIDDEHCRHLLRRSINFNLKFATVDIKVDEDQFSLVERV